MFAEPLSGMSDGPLKLIAIDERTPSSANAIGLTPLADAPSVTFCVAEESTAPVLLSASTVNAFVVPKTAGTLMLQEMVVVPVQSGLRLGWISTVTAGSAAKPEGLTTMEIESVFGEIHARWRAAFAAEGAGKASETETLPVFPSVGSAGEVVVGGSEAELPPPPHAAIVAAEAMASRANNLLPMMTGVVFAPVYEPPGELPP
jgi:hypothetical protein